MKNKQRNASFELLRMISMCMVIVLHALDKSKILASTEGGVNHIISWILESLCIQAVNVYVLISGYFLVKSRFKTTRLVELICQVLFYSVIGLFVGLSFNLFEPGYINNYTLFEFFFPIHANKYWFITKYIIMYLFSPVLALAVNKMSQKKLSLIIIFLVIYESVVKSISPIIFVPDNLGYDALWFMILFLIAGYIRLYGLKAVDTKGKAIGLYVIGAALIFAENEVVSVLNQRTGHFAELKKVAFNYNHIFALLSSIGLFMIVVNGKKIEGKIADIICAVSPMTLGVYLFHENPAIRFKWQEIFGLYDAYTKLSLRFILCLLGAVICMFIVGMCFDFVRKCIFDLIKKLTGRMKITAWLNKLDGIINEE